MILSKKELQSVVKAATPVRRKNRTLSLDDENYERFQELCRLENLAGNKVIDRLLEVFMESYKETKS